MRILLPLILLLLLAACGQPLPNDKQSYVGDWRGQNMKLTIASDGRVEYERKDGNGSRTIDAPIKEFQGDDFIVGVGFIKTTFVVKARPHERDGRWHMVVDGVDLTRVDSETSLQVERL